MNRLAGWFLAALVMPFVLIESALARVDVNVDLSSQRMTVLVDGRHYATWTISSGRRGYYTPRGTWRPTWLKRMHYSSKYNNAPMPWSIFYFRGYAIHGTDAISRLGRPASHGCIRLHPRNAARLFELVRRHGRKNVRIRVRGSTDVAYARLAAERKRRLAERRKLRNKRKARKARQYRNRRSAQLRQERRREVLRAYGALSVQ